MSSSGNSFKLCARVPQLLSAFIEQFDMFDLDDRLLSNTLLLILNKKIFQILKLNFTHLFLNEETLCD